MEEGISSLYLRPYTPVGNSEPLFEKIYFFFFWAKAAFRFGLLRFIMWLPALSTGNAKWTKGEGMLKTKEKKSQDGPI